MSKMTTKTTVTSTTLETLPRSPLRTRLETLAQFVSSPNTPKVMIARTPSGKITGAALVVRNNSTQTTRNIVIAFDTSSNTVAREALTKAIKEQYDRYHRKYQFV